MSSSAFTPFLPPMDPYVLPNAPFDQLINAYGLQMTWQKSHACPCSSGGGTQSRLLMTGAPDPQCQTCGGRGVYWDAPQGPFTVMLTFMHRAFSKDEPGAAMDNKYGLVQEGEPTLTIPSSVTAPYQQASLYDAWVNINAETYYETNLTVGGNETVPYQQSLSIAASGAVKVYDPATHQVVAVSGYTVSGGTVTLPGQYPPGTGYVVGFTAAPVYVAFKSSGAYPHIRPFQQIPLPRRFSLRALDLWLRARGSDTYGTSPNVP